MTAGTPPAAGPPGGDSQDGDRLRFIERTCLPYLRGAQNQDGGWGFASGLQSRIEPTAWALLTLQGFPGGKATDEALQRGARFMRETQLADGSWPSAAGQAKGCWVTSLACWVLLARKESSPSLVRGLRWLGEEKPRDAGLWWRLMRSLVGNRSVTSQNESLSGWPWTSGTASWVEPTSYALIVLGGSPEGLVPAQARSRQQLAEALLYDRMCQVGGWNCGNPMVYGVPGQPMVSTTVWPLLALRRHSQRAENLKSLDWLESNWQGLRSPGSLALAGIALNAYGRRSPSLERSLREFFEQKEVLWTVPVVAWTVLALGDKPGWLDFSTTEAS
jgi:hypothetical protein